MRKPKPPRPPRELCGNNKNYILGVVSPSLYYLYDFDDHGNENVIQYFKELRIYKFDLIEWKIQNRTATKEEYKYFMKRKRRLYAEI